MIVWTLDRLKGFYLFPMHTQSQFCYKCVRLLDQCLWYYRITSATFEKGNIQQCARAYHGGESRLSSLPLVTHLVLL